MASLKLITLITLSQFLGPSYLLATPELVLPQDTKNLAVSHYIDETPNHESVLISGGKFHGLQVGSTLTAFRKLRQPTATLWIPTGTIQVTEMQDEVSVANILENGTDRSRRLYPKFPGIMASDILVENRVTISQRVHIAPTLTLRYDEIFDDPKSSPETFEISRAGQSALIDKASVFVSQHLPILLVEGFTDEEGPSDANQIESYQRAQTVRQFLINHMGFAPDRVLAVGQGENETIDDSKTPGFRERNRRIVIKAIGNNIGSL